MESNLFEKMKAVVEATEKDAEKFYTKGNSAAGTRLRKSMQDIKSLAQDVRKNVQETKNAAKA
jgi:hypothetical protein